MKKRINSVLAYLLGSMCVIALGLGLLMLIPSEVLRNVLAVIIICLSICFGMLSFNPLCFYGLITGVCMLMFPSGIVAIVLLVIGAAGSVANLLVWRKHFL